MFTSHLLSLAALFASASAVVYKGFNYGATNTDNSAVVESGFADLFTTAQNLVGTSGFTSARLYTMIQAGTTNTPTEAIPAAISTKTTLLLGLWASAGGTIITNEIAALTAAIQQYGTNFTDLVVGISVGSEDLYRNSPIGIENLSGIGAQPTDIVSYISQLRSAIANTPLSGAPVGHVDTWTAWVNGSNDAVISACDFLGVDEYPYFQNTVSNGIDSGYELFFEAYNATVAVSGGKPVWVTETGWAVSGPTMNLAVASVPNAQTYWDQVGCAIFGNINTWWFTLRDSYPTTPSPSFGIVGSTLTTTPLYNLTCPIIVPNKDGSSTSSSASASGFSVGATSSAGSASASATGKSVGAVIKPASGLAIGVIAIVALFFI